MKRVILIILITGAGLIASFVDAFYGLLLYTWYSFASPLQLTYGTLDHTRLSLIVASILIFTTFSQKRMLIYPSWIALFSALYLLTCIMSLTFIGKFSVEYILNSIELIGKIIFMALLAPTLISTIQRFNIFVLVITGSISLLATYYGFGGLLVGSTSIVGPGRIGDNNSYSALLVATLPLVYYCYFNLINNKQRIISLFIILGMFISIILTFSRGGLIACVVVLFSIILYTRFKLLMLGIASILASIVIWQYHSGQFAPLERLVFKREFNNQTIIEKTTDLYLYRVQTLFDNPNDLASANSRIHFWKTALLMAKENPFFGVGLHKYQDNFKKYDTSNGEFGITRSVHSTPLLVISETGWVGFTFFMLIFISSLYYQSLAKKLAIKFERKTKNQIREFVNMLRISMLGFGISSLFVVTLFQEILWIYPALSYSIYRVCKIKKEE